MAPWTRCLIKGNHSWHQLDNTCSSLLSQLLSCPARRQSSSASSSRWKARQGKDSFTREAKLKTLKSRAAFKILEMDSKYRLFKRGQTIIDLGFAPGSWSQVALERTKPRGQVIGIDVLPAQPPRGVSAIQGNFLSPAVRSVLKDFIRESDCRRTAEARDDEECQRDMTAAGIAAGQAARADDMVVVVDDGPGYVDMEKAANQALKSGEEGGDSRNLLVDVVLSDMSEPWIQPSDLYKNGMSNAYYRMMNTSGIPFRDHAGSMDLCSAALHFASETLKPGGHFVCKYYQGAEDRAFEKRLQRLFTKVHREKPEASRKESKEAYFVALRRRKDIMDE